MLLAIDTSTGIASLALATDNEIISEMTWPCRSNHSVELLPRLEAMLKLARLSPAELGAIVVARGPGSFNGLRVGVSTAKALAFSLKLPLVGVSTLAAAAYSQAGAGLPVCALLPAGREEMAVALFQRRDGAWHVIKAEHLATIAALADTINTPTVFCGEFTQDVATELARRLGDNARIATPAACLRRAAYLAELGAAELRAGRAGDAATLQPLYLRRPPITERKSRT